MLGHPHAPMPVEGAPVSDWLPASVALVVGPAPGSAAPCWTRSSPRAPGSRAGGATPPSGDTLRAGCPRYRSSPATGHPPGEATSGRWRPTVEGFGGLDVLVSCVGVFDFYRGLGELDAEPDRQRLRRDVRGDVKSYLHSVKAALPALRASRVGWCSPSRRRRTTRGAGGVLYVSAKFAVRGLVTALAHELAPDVEGQRRRPRRHAAHRPAGLDSLGLAGRRLDDTPRPGSRAGRHGYRSAWPRRRRPRVELRCSSRLLPVPGHHRRRHPSRRRHRSEWHDRPGRPGRTPRRGGRRCRVLAARELSARHPRPHQPCASTPSGCLVRCRGPRERGLA